MQVVSTESRRDGLQRQAYSLPEVARLLGISRSHAYEMAYQGEIRVSRLGKRLLVPTSEVDRILNGRAGD